MLQCNCWLSPNADLIRCGSHEDMADKIIKDFGLSGDYVAWCKFSNESCKEAFLYYKGFVKYCDNLLYHGWVIESVKLTQAQIDKIYELTGDVIQDQDLL